MRDGMGRPNPSCETIFSAANEGREKQSSLAEQEEGWQPYPIDPYSTECPDHKYIRIYSGHVRDIHQVSDLFESGELSQINR